jgi:pyruvate kinase
VTSWVHEGHNIIIISRIESHEGLKNFEENLLVAQGKLGMEIPSDKGF